MYTKKPRIPVRRSWLHWLVGTLLMVPGLPALHNVPAHKTPTTTVDQHGPFWPGGVKGGPMTICQDGTTRPWTMCPENQPKP